MAVNPDGLRACQDELIVLSGVGQVGVPVEMSGLAQLNRPSVTGESVYKTAVAKIS